MNRTSQINNERLAYAFRRVIYNLMVIAHSICLLEDSDDEPIHPSLEKFPSRAVFKISALIMSRNINDFLFNRGGNNHPDDITFDDFCMDGWSPSEHAELSEENRKRIHKIAGHIVS